MTRFAAALAAAVLAFPAVAADDEKAPAPKGAWVKKDENNEFELTFDFKDKTELVVTVDAGGNGCTLTCEYKVDKDGKVSAKAIDVKEKGDFPAKPAKGYEFKFKIKVDGKTAKITDFEAENADQAKAIVEGEYKQKGD